MPRQVDIDGVMTEMYTKAELDQAIESEVAGLKVTNTNLKSEKEDAKTKLAEAKEAERVALEAKATAEGDKESLARLGAERDAEKQLKIDSLINSSKSDKISVAINGIIAKLAATGPASEDLLDLIKSRFTFDFNMETQQVTVSGAGVATIADLEKAITTSGRYDQYLAGTKATGGGAAGSQGGGSAKKEYKDMTTGERSTFFREFPEQAEIESQKYEESK